MIIAEEQNLDTIGNSSLFKSETWKRRHVEVEAKYSKKWADLKTAYFWTGLDQN